MKTIWEKEISVFLNGNLIARNRQIIHQYTNKPDDIFWRGTIKKLIEIDGTIPNYGYKVYTEHNSKKPTISKRNGTTRIFFKYAINNDDFSFGTKCRETDTIKITITHHPAYIKSFQELMTILPPDDFIEWLKDRGLITTPINIKTGDDNNGQS